jgi:putative dimethyl sulfoxide reductase chaperone
MELTNLQGAAECTAAGRSRLYQLLALAFTFPDEDFYAAIQDCSFAAAVAQACTALPYALSFALPPAGDAYVDFESEYIRLFDVGPAGPPCPLYGGVYIGDRMKTMEDATRFYNFFELRLSPQMRELPDHITTELEFLHYLTFREAQVRQHGIDPAPLLRAQRDFLTRHLCKWLPRLRARLAKQTTVPFLPALVDFAARFCAADQAFAAAACGE